MTENTARLSTALADRYKIERHLGEGGMAIEVGLWRASGFALEGSVYSFVSAVCGADGSTARAPGPSTT